MNRTNAIALHIRKHANPADASVETLLKNLATHGTAIETLRKKLADDMAGIRTSVEEAANRIGALEARGNRQALGGGDVPASVLKSIADHERIKAFLDGSTHGVTFQTAASLRMLRKGLLTSSQQPLSGSPSSDTISVASQALGPQGAVQRRISLIDLLPSIPVQSNTVEYPRVELVDSQQEAGVQLGEGDAKQEASTRFEQVTDSIATVAHYLPVSKQVLGDSPLLQAFLSRLLEYGVMLKLENLLINGNGTSDKIAGLLTLATTFAAGAGLPQVDKVGQAAAWAAGQGMVPDVLVINPLSWFDITSERGEDGHYVSITTDRGVYDLQVAKSPKIALGTALVVDSSQTSIFDREQVRTEIGYTNDQFVRNQLTLLSEGRWGLGVYHDLASIKVTL